MFEYMHEDNADKENDANVNKQVTQSLVTPKTKETAYKTPVRPQLEHRTAAWEPHEKGDIATLEKVQRRAARFITGDYSRESSVTHTIKNIGRQSFTRTLNHK